MFITQHTGGNYIYNAFGDGDQVDDDEDEGDLLDSNSDGMERESKMFKNIKSKWNLLTAKNFTFQLYFFSSTIQFDLL